MAPSAWSFGYWATEPTRVPALMAAMSSLEASKS